MELLWFFAMVFVLFVVINFCESRSKEKKDNNENQPSLCDTCTGRECLWCSGYCPYTNS